MAEDISQKAKMADFNRSGGGSTMGGPGNYGGMEAAKKEWEALQRAKAAAAEKVMTGENDVYQTAQEAYENLEDDTTENDNEAVTFFERKTLSHKNLYKEYGNNYFELQTSDNGTNIILAGILKELPEFSCSTEWEEGPGGTIGKAIKDYINDDTIQSINFIGGSTDYAPLLAIDALTERTYATTSYGNFELNFRIYPMQIIGSTRLTNADVWMKSLLKCTSPESGNGIISKSVVTAISDTFASGKVIMDSIVNVIKGKHEEYNFTDELDKLQNANFDERYGKDRVFSTSNSEGKFGAKLFELTLFPFIFGEPIPVCISDWTVNPSQECCLVNNHREHVYYDFKITCCMDQIPSKIRWLSYLKR